MNGLLIFLGVYAAVCTLVIAHLIVLVNAREDDDEETAPAASGVKSCQWSVISGQPSGVKPYSAIPTRAELAEERMERKRMAELSDEERKKRLLAMLRDKPRIGRDYGYATGAKRDKQAAPAGGGSATAGYKGGEDGES